MTANNGVTTLRPVLWQQDRFAYWFIRGKPNKIPLVPVKEIELQQERHSVPTRSSEDQLIGLAKDCDRQAFGQLVLHHRQGVVNIVYRMCGDSHLAEDAAQEAFVRAWQHIAAYRPRSSFRNWVYRIATNAALDIIRREKEVVNIEAVSLASQADGPESAIEQKERGEQVRQLVLALPPASRAVLILREFEDLSYKEIAYTLDIPIGTVMSRLSYARNLMQKALSEQLEVQ